MESSRSLGKKGGIKTIPFIMGNEIFERVASSGLQANMMIYLTREYHMSAATSASTLFIWGAISNFAPIIGAVLSDAFFGRFRVIAVASVACLTGITLLWLTTVLPSAKPPACVLGYYGCQPPSLLQIAFLCCGFIFMSAGASGIRACSIAFGADQFSQRNDTDKKRVLQNFFNWYYASIGISVMIAVTIVVYIEDTVGWKVGFAVPVVLMALSAASFLLGSSLYIKVKPHKSMITDFVQVIVAAVKNRHLDLPPMTDVWRYHHKEGSVFIVPSDKFSFFNKACIVKNPERELNPDGSSSNPWKLCTVKQVEEFKSAIRVMPIWSTMIMFALVLGQSFGVLQAATMNRKIGSKFEVPAGSFGVSSLITLTVWSGGYDRFFVPVLRKITRRPDGLSLKQRMGIGLFLSIIATIYAMKVEAARRRTAIKQGLQDHMGGVVNMSAMWLLPHGCLIGLAEAFVVIGQVEFFYSELPKCMASFGVSLFYLGAGVANLFGTLMIKLVNELSGRDGRTSWLSNNLNKGHYDYYYGLLALLSSVNLICFLVCSWAYGETGKNRHLEEEDERDYGVQVTHGSSP
ncbi:protein NRT1/ PTR FAMILY 1.2-like [Typha angustifolia]|uniref:protein NRT1/ PTR FAMILY 1.2-like n=1 Tax=Typha angustifolia TaxID=59011 RepID=UPI003C2DBE30